MFLYNPYIFYNPFQVNVSLPGPPQLPTVKIEEPKPPQLICKIENLTTQKDEFLNLLEQELKKRAQKPIDKKPKPWTADEDQRLIQLGRQSDDWQQIAIKFPGKNQSICCRRYHKLMNKARKWPKETEEKIKYMREVEKKSWIEIQKHFSENSAPKLQYKAKQIRERYKNYLQIDQLNDDWEVRDDLRLWQQICENGNKWTCIAKSFQGRTQLQIKNRFYKVINPLKEKITKMSRKKKGRQ